jgi:hypothetical protein
VRYSPGVPPRTIWRLALANVVLHATGLGLAATVLRPGAVPPEAAARAAYMASHRTVWATGWSVWGACALAQVAFLAVLSEGRERGPGAGEARVALVLATGGAAVDLTCDTLWAALVPDVAAAGPTLLFLTLERALSLAGQAVANGLYSVAVLLATVAVGNGRLGMNAVGLSGLLTFATGFGLVTAGAVGSLRLLPATSAATILCFMAWCVIVARHEHAGRTAAR